MKTNYSSNCYDNASLGADLRIPESPELERAVLGALLLEPQYVADVRVFSPQRHSMTPKMRRSTMLFANSMTGE